MGEDIYAEIYNYFQGQFTPLLKEKGFVYEDNEWSNQRISYILKPLVRTNQAHTNETQAPPTDTWFQIALMGIPTANLDITFTKKVNNSLVLLLSFTWNYNLYRFGVVDWLTAKHREIVFPEKWKDEINYIIESNSNEIISICEN